MKQEKSTASFVLVVLLTLSAWVLTIIAVILLYVVGAKATEIFNDSEFELPGLTLFLLDLSAKPIYIPIVFVIVSTMTALGLLLGWYRRRLMIILALLANVLIIAFLATMFFSFFNNMIKMIESTSVTLPTSVKLRE